MDGFSAAAGAFSFAKVVLYCIDVLDDYRRLFVAGELGYLVSKCDGPTSTLTSNIYAAEESDFYHDGNGYFGDLVQRLNLSSVKGSAHQRKVVYIYGARGLGKTHLCSEFADRHKTRYWGVFWYRFGDKRVESLDPSSKIRLISQLSGVQESWLLIMDNASCLAHAESVLPNSDRAHILITTELSPAETANSIHVLDMDHEDKKEFLLWAAGFVKPWCDSDIAWSEDIMKLVGPKAVPRTLSYVGATIRSGSCAPEEYIAMFEKEQILELKGDIQQEPDKLAFDMAVAQIQKQNTRISKDALKLLNISSFFTTRYITLSTLTKSLIIYDTTREEQRRTQSNRRAGTCRITNRFWPSKRSKRNGEVHHMHPSVAWSPTPRVAD
ncbi:hypothetical protein N7497_006226 [Penicillium chrysogenum]|nr:hypothetical protein N7497_006226 [Penicillium chrysogenum]